MDSLHRLGKLNDCYNLNKLDEIPALKTAFDALTLGQQRAYILYFSAPKQSKTRESRIEKCVPQILNGRGLNEREMERK